MKKIERGTKKYLFILIISVSLCGIMLYPLFDFLLCKFITNTQFTYSLHSHVVQPILFGFIYGITFWLIDKKRK